MKKILLSLICFVAAIGLKAQTSITVTNTTACPIVFYVHVDNTCGKSAGMTSAMSLAGGGSVTLGAASFTPSIPFSSSCPMTITGGGASGNPMSYNPPDGGTFGAYPSTLNFNVSPCGPVTLTVSSPSNIDIN